MSKMKLRLFDMESNQKSSPLEKDESVDRVASVCIMKKVNEDNIDEDAWYVCNKVWKILEESPNFNDEERLNERLANIQVRKKCITITIKSQIITQTLLTLVNIFK